MERLPVRGGATGLLVACAAMLHGGPLHAQEAAPAATVEAGPVVRSLHVEIPSGSAMTNALMIPALGSSPAVKQLEQVMALGETAELEVVVFSGSDKLALKAAEAALKSFQGKRLPHLTLGVVADAGKVEALRPLAEPMGVKLVASPSLQR